MVRTSDGRKERIYGTPGVPGPFHDLPNTKYGAEEAERRAINAVMNGKPLATAAPSIEEPAVRKLLRDHAAPFMETYKPEQKPSTKRKRKVSLKRLLPWFGDLAANGVEQTRVGEYTAAELERGVSHKTISDDLACLSCWIKHATGEKPKLRLHVDGMDPEIHAVDPDDVERLLAACKDGRDRVVILLASEAGLRAGEIRGLQWTDVKDGQVTVRRALDDATDAVLSPKHDKSRNVPLSPRLAGALATLPRRGLWIVSDKDGDHINSRTLRYVIGTIYDRAEVVRPKMPLHCLRHTFGTVMARRGVPLPVLQRLMGHSDIQTTMRYIDVGERDAREAIASVFGERAAPHS